MPLCPVVAVGPHSPIGYNSQGSTSGVGSLQLARIPPSAITTETLPDTQEQLQLARIPPSAITVRINTVPAHELQLARIPPSAITSVGAGIALTSCSWPAFPHRL